MQHLWLTPDAIRGDIYVLKVSGRSKKTGLTIYEDVCPGGGDGDEMLLVSKVLRALLDAHWHSHFHEVPYLDKYDIARRLKGPGRETEHMNDVGK